MEHVPGLHVDSIGDYIRDQRRNARISLRQLADLAGVSNPYLSQIERGLRRPSAEILQQIAKGLRISAETLYVRAGILDARDGSREVSAAILGDHGLSERQKRVLLDIYEAFRHENTAAAAAAAAAVEPAAAGETAATRKRPTKKATTPRARAVATPGTTRRTAARRVDPAPSPTPGPTPVRRSRPTT